MRNKLKQSCSLKDILYSYMEKY